MEHISEDQAFREAHFTWKHRMIAAVSLRTNSTYTVRHGLAAGMKRRGGLGFLPFGSAETEEERFLRGLNFKGLTVYDIGRLRRHSQPVLQPHRATSDRL